MEQDSKKRVREGDHDHHAQHQKNHSKRLAKSKQQQDHGLFDIVDDFQDDQYKTLGVFDFPWLKDGVVSKSEDGWKLEDVFSSPLDETSTVTTTIAGIEFSFSGQCLCQATPETLLDLPEAKFEETESVDCIWSSLLNQPPRQPN
ncbi:hypothetical protein FNV43_RR08015 [Rhamnella rubrinervis]|uniref:Uncharacterized protein n=1 Tax=Rhamnella rubrinervis TaxID=2594499 RepID=A0A8K0HHP1_9ROSA|nr:hypothetical protein FNV43_RR08015 [Rhamnella rubrinervis]